MIYYLILYSVNCGVNSNYCEINCKLDKKVSQLCSFIRLFNHPLQFQQEFKIQTTRNSALIKIMKTILNTKYI